MPALRELTLRQFQELETQDYKNGGLTSFRLPETGLGARLYLTVTGSLSVDIGTGTATMSPLGIGNIASRINLRLNDGTLIYEMDGFNTAIPSMLQNGYDPQVTTISRAYTGTTPYVAPNKGAALATQNYPINFTYEVPIMNNDKDMLGLILLQNGTTQATVEIQWNKASGADGLSSLVALTGNASATFTATVTPNLEYFMLPSAPADQLKAILAPHLRWVNIWKSEYEAITSTATYKKKLERGNIYTKIAHRIITNGSLDSTAVSNLRILMKGNEVPLTIKRDLQLYLQKRNYGFDLPDGLFVHDLDRSFGIEAFGDMRDYIDSRTLTELVSELQYDSGVNFGANSFVYTITNKLQQVNI